jgi:hypothetical protein
MSDDKKLRLVPSGDTSGAGSRPVDGGRLPSWEDEPPPTEAELAEAEAIRLALEEGTEPISNSLRAANAPVPLSTPDHEALLALALGDLAAAPTQLEQLEAGRLAKELEGEIRGEGSAPLQLARALRAAHAPRGLDQVTHERILKKALGEAPKKTAKTSSRSSRIVLASGFLVAAAAFALFFVGSRNASAPSSARSVSRRRAGGRGGRGVGRAGRGARVRHEGQARAQRRWREDGEEQRVALRFAASRRATGGPL